MYTNEEIEKLKTKLNSFVYLKDEIDKLEHSLGCIGIYYEYNRGKGSIHNKYKLTGSITKDVKEIILKDMRARMKKFENFIEGTIIINTNEI